MKRQIPLVALMLFVLGGSVLTFAAYQLTFRTTGHFVVTNSEALVAPTTVDFGQFTGVGGFHDVDVVLRTSSGTAGSYRVSFTCNNIPPNATLQMRYGGNVITYIDLEPAAANPKTVTLRLIIPAGYPSTTGYDLNIDWVGDLL